MFGLTSERKLRQAELTSSVSVIALTLKLQEWQEAYNELRAEHDRLRSNYDQLSGIAGEFSDEDVDRLIRLCHPDKHNGSEASNAITAKLLTVRENRRA